MNCPDTLLSRWRSMEARLRSIQSQPMRLIACRAPSHAAQPSTNVRRRQYRSGMDRAELMRHLDIAAEVLGLARGDL